MIMNGESSAVFESVNYPVQHLLAMLDAGAGQGDSQNCGSVIIKQINLGYGDLVLSVQSVLKA